MALSQKEWSELITDWKSSGQSARQFARVREVPEQAFRYWIRRLAPPAKPSTSVGSVTTALARVVRPGERPESGARVQIVVGDASITVEPGFDEAHLRAVVRALSESR